MALVEVPAADYFPVIYPASINPSNFDWSVESSLDLVSWMDKESWREGNSICIQRTNATEFYRLKGTP